MSHADTRRITAALEAIKGIPTRQLEILASYSSDEARLSWLAWSAYQVIRGNDLPDGPAPTAVPSTAQADRLAALGRLPSNSPFALQRIP